MPTFRQRVPAPPSSITGPLRNYLEQIAAVLNSQPVFSTFSGLTPNSRVSGLPGDITVNIGSTSTTSRIWVKGGAANTMDTANWAVVRVLL